MSMRRSFSSGVEAGRRPHLSACRALAAVLLLSSLAGAATAFAKASADSGTAPHGLGVTLAGLTVPFEANVGQFDSAVAYAARTVAGTSFVTAEGRIVHALRGKPARPGEGRAAVRAPRRSEGERPGWTLVETLVGTRALAPAGVDPTPTHVSRLHGRDPARWQRDIATFDRVSLGEAWPGITVDLVVRDAGVERLFTLAPGADVSRIRLVIRGARALRVAGDGALVADTGIGAVRFSPPLAYQTIGDERRAVAVRYTRAAAYEYGFRLGGHDAAAPLSIDPLVQATYLGGAGGDEEILEMAVAGDGSVFVAGDTASSTFPGTAGGAQANHYPDAGAARTDVFVAKLSADLRTLVQATYLGGDGLDYAYALALDSTGSVYVAGDTTSTNFPGTAGGAQPALRGGGPSPHDGFVARLSGNLKTIAQATYLGGSQDDFVTALRLDRTGKVCVAGYTYSLDFPATANGAQASLAGAGDAFLARLGGDLKSIVQATYFGGSNPDFGLALALDASGSVFLTGDTGSTNLPNRSGAAQASMAGGPDGFVAKLSGDLLTLVRSTYFGGNLYDYPYALEVDAGGSVFVAGYTYSTDLPGRAGGAQPSHAIDGGRDDAFVAKLSNDLKNLVQSTYLGGNGRDNIRSHSMMLEGLGSVLLAGATRSTDFPGTAGGTQAGAGGAADGFVVRISNDLRAISQATYLGGSGNDLAYALARDGSGNVLVAGYTDSVNLPGALGGAQPSHSPGSGGDAFVAKLTANLSATPGKLAQTIVFPPLPVQGFSPARGFAVSATASSGLPVTFATTTPVICSVSGDTVRSLTRGTCTVTANQPGSTNYNPAPQVSRDIVIAVAVARRLPRAH